MNALAYDATSNRYEHLFLAMAEELKLPLQHIARQAELQQLHQPVTSGGADMVAEARRLQNQGLHDIQASADMSLQLLDSYLLSLRLSLQPEASLELEPVSVSAVLHDTMGELRHIAANY